MIDKNKKILMLVESPHKTKKIQHILRDAGYNVTVIASVGHIANIKDNKASYKNTGIYPDQDFKIDYAVTNDKKELLNSLAAQVKAADYIYLATDPDREGEQISWSLIKFLKIKEYKRVVMHEITPKAVLYAFEHPTTLNTNLVEAAQARAALDKLLGYALSPVVRNYLGCKSVGRAQSVGLKLVADRENEIKNFVPETYYDLYLRFTKNSTAFKAKYIGTETKKIDHLKSKDDIKVIKAQCDADYKISEIARKTKLENPKPPFCTSSIQQECATAFGLKVKDTMSICQKLFEQGLITYHRSDSTEFSAEFLDILKQYINSNYNNSYTQPPIGKKTGLEQEGHECIRCTDLNLTPDIAETTLKNSYQAKVYRLIWQRTVATALPPAKIAETNYIIKNNQHKFLLQSNELIDNGYRIVYTSQATEVNDKLLSETFVENEVLEHCKLETETKQTTSPSRYTEASLVKALEASGVGRPSTYATIVDTVTSEIRGYAKIENKKIVPTEKGMILAAYVDRNFSDLINLNYTKEMEDKLDQIAAGKLSKLSFLQSFYDVLEETIKNNKETGVQVEQRICPNCGSTLVLKRSKFGTLFYACPGYPTCRYTESR